MKINNPIKFVTAGIVGTLLSASSLMAASTAAANPLASMPPGFGIPNFSYSGAATGHTFLTSGNQIFAAGFAQLEVQGDRARFGHPTPIPFTHHLAISQNQVRIAFIPQQFAPAEPIRISNAVRDGWNAGYYADIVINPNGDIVLQPFYPTRNTTIMMNSGTATLYPFVEWQIPPQLLNEGRLIISKRDASQIGDPATGAPVPNSQLGNPVADVEFTVRRVLTIDGYEADMLTGRGRGLAASVSLEETLRGERVTLGTAVVGRTGATGELVKNLPFGLYLVTPTSTPPGVVPSQPFMVSLPMANPGGEGWLNEVWVYPKSDVVGINTAVDVTSARVLGDTVIWQVLADIPRGADPVTGYLVVSDIDARLNLGEVSVALTDQPVALQPGDYQVLFDEYARQLQVRLTASGISRLNDPNLGVLQQVQITINTAVTEVGLNGVITKQSWLFPSAQSVVAFIPGADPTALTSAFPPVAAIPRDTRWGGVEIIKTSAATELPLAGASFQVFLTEADAQAGTNPLTKSGTELHSDSGSLWVTDGAGQISIDGLRLSEFGVPATSGFDGTASHAHPGFWLRQVLAVPGYELLATPVHFHVNQVLDQQPDVQLYGVPLNAGFALPLTGGTGDRNFAFWALLVAVSGFGAVALRRNAPGKAGALGTMSVTRFGNAI